MAVVSSRVTVQSGSATMIVPSEGDQKGCLIRNLGSVAVEIDGDATITIGAGYPLGVGEGIALDLTPGDAVYGLAASGTCVVAVLTTGD